MVEKTLINKTQDLSLKPKSGIIRGKSSLNLHFLSWKSVITAPLLKNG